MSKVSRSFLRSLFPWWSIRKSRDMLPNWEVTEVQDTDILPNLIVHTNSQKDKKILYFRYVSHVKKACWFSLSHSIDAAYWYVFLHVILKIDNQEILDWKCCCWASVIAKWPEFWMSFVQKPHSFPIVFIFRKDS